MTLKWIFLPSHLFNNSFCLKVNLLISILIAKKSTFYLEVNYNLHLNKNVVKESNIKITYVRKVAFLDFVFVFSL